MQAGLWLAPEEAPKDPLRKEHYFSTQQEVLEKTQKG